MPKFTWAYTILRIKCEYCERRLIEQKHKTHFEWQFHVVNGLKFSCSLFSKRLLVQSEVNYLPNNVGLKISFVLLYLFYRFDLLSLEVYFIWCQPSLFWTSIWHAFPKLLIAKLRVYQNHQENKKTLFFQGGEKPNQSRHSQISVYFLLTCL